MKQFNGFAEAQEAAKYSGSERLPVGAYECEVKNVQYVTGEDGNSDRIDILFDIIDTLLAEKAFDEADTTATEEKTDEDEEVVEEENLDEGEKIPVAEGEETIAEDEDEETPAEPAN